MRRLLLVFFSSLALASCGATPTPVPTPLPTAVPPDSVQLAGSWAIGFQYEFPAGEFAKGVHRYRYWLHCPPFSAEDTNIDWILFEVSEEAELQPGPLYLRLHGLSPDPLTPSSHSTNAIHPDQQLIAVVHYVGLPRTVTEAAAEECEVMIFWDNIGRQLLMPMEPFEQ